MSDAVLTRDGPVAVPLDYTVPNGGELLPLTVRATMDGTSAATSFYAVVQVIAPSGRVMASAITTAIAAGASADVSWFPWCRVATSTTPPPTPVGTAYAWYDFSDTSSLIIDGSGNIQTANDKTGNGHTITQGTAAARPGQTTINGLNAALCNTAAYTYLIGGPWAPRLEQPYTVFIVYTQTTGGIGGNYLPGPLGNYTATSTGVLLQITNGNNWLAVVQGTSIVDASVTVPFTKPQLVTIAVDGASSRIDISGGSSTGGTLQAGSPLDTIALGAAHVPERLPLVEGLDGAIGEMLAYTTHLSAAQRAGIEAYLRAKWNTA